ncbi:MAG: fatty acid desaturase [Pseudomonadota bacterium]
MKSTEKKINWVNVAFFIITPLVGIVGTILLCSFGLVKWQTWLFFVGYLYVTMIAITAGYHRLFAHKSYQASPIVRFFMLLLGSANFVGSALEFATDHRDHHRYSDTDKDLYSIKHGFWHAHLGWILHLDLTKRHYSNVKDLTASAMICFQHKYFTIIASFMAFIFPMLVASLWGNALAGLIVAGVLRVVVINHATFFINSLCHWSGKQTYSKIETARDNWLTALVTMGEGFHNFHHQFPLDYRNGIRYFHYDPTKWLIYGLSKLGLTSHLRRVSNHKILTYQLRVEEENLRSKHEQNAAFFHQKIEPLKTHMLTLIDKITHLESELAILKNQKLEYMKDRYQTYKHQLQDYLHAIKVAQQELNQSLMSWRQLCI